MLDFQYKTLASIMLFFSLVKYGKLYEQSSMNRKQIYRLPLYSFQCISTIVVRRVKRRLPRSFLKASSVKKKQKEKIINFSGMLANHKIYVSPFPKINNYSFQLVKDTMLKASKGTNFLGKCQFSS